MKRYRCLTAVLATAAVFCAQAQTSDNGTATTHKKSAHTEKKRESATEAELREMREEMRAMKAEMDELKQELANKGQQAAAAQQSASDAQAQAATAAAAATQASTTATQASTAAAENSSKTDALQTKVDDLKTTSDTLTDTVVGAQAQMQQEIHEPGTIHYKGVEITPGGFLAAESVDRSRAINSDINTPFNSTPYMNSGQAYTSEFNGSGRQSRLSVKVAANESWGKLIGYYEMDFLGAGITSNNNQSNSYVMRQRQIWGRVERNNGFAFTGGQTWSLVTETKQGLMPGTENLPATIDAQYHVGFSWERQYSLRFAQTFGKSTVGFSLEEPQIVGYTSSTTPPDFFVGNIGTGGGLYNLSNKYTNNLAPDMIVKYASDPGYGHYEIGGTVRFFRSRVYPNVTGTSTSTAGAYNNTVVGGGFFANARFPMTKYLDIGLHAMGGDGVNRYGTSQLPDVTVHSDGTLEPLRGLQGLLSLETHPTKKLDVFGYAGSEYAQRTYYTVGSTIYGYAPPSINVSTCFTETAPSAPSTGSTGGVFGGAPYDPSSSCGAQTRDITQGTLGFTYRFYNSPTKGRFQYSMQYSYLTKTAWDGLFSGTYGTPSAVYAAPHATNNMVFTSFRYYIP
jgi:hypothetical protein